MHKSVLICMYECYNKRWLFPLKVITDWSLWLRRNILFFEGRMNFSTQFSYFGKKKSSYKSLAVCLVYPSFSLCESMSVHFLVNPNVFFLGGLWNRLDNCVFVGPINFFVFYSVRVIWKGSMGLVIPTTTSLLLLFISAFKTWNAEIATMTNHLINISYTRIFFIL